MQAQALLREADAAAPARQADAVHRLELRSRRKKGVLIGSLLLSATAGALALRNGFETPAVRDANAAHTALEGATRQAAAATSSASVAGASRLPIEAASPTRAPPIATHLHDGARQTARAAVSPLSRRAASASGRPTVPAARPGKGQPAPFRCNTSKRACRQRRLLRDLLAQSDPQIRAYGETMPLRAFVNEVIAYQSKSPAHRARVAQCLRAPTGQPDGDASEVLAGARQHRLIAHWLTKCVFGQPLEAWLRGQMRDMRRADHGLFHQANLLRRLTTELNRKSRQGELNGRGRRYFQDHVLKPMLPTMSMTFKNAEEQQRVSQMMLDRAPWADLHAAILLLRESGAEPSELGLDELIALGQALEIVLRLKLVPQHYADYFAVAALLRSAARDADQASAPNGRSAETHGVDARFFEDLRRERLRDNPFVQLRERLCAWRVPSASLPGHTTGTALRERQPSASQPATERGTSPESRPDTQLALQKQRLAAVFQSADQIMLAQGLASLREAEQTFLRGASLIKLRAEAGDDTLRDAQREAPTPPGAGGDPLAGSVDLLMARAGAEEHIYALRGAADGVNVYAWRRVDHQVKAVHALRRADAAPCSTSDCKPTVFLTRHLLKLAHEPLGEALDRLAGLHRDALLHALSEQVDGAAPLQRLSEHFPLLKWLGACASARGTGGTAQDNAAGIGVPSMAIAEDDSLSAGVDPETRRAMLASLRYASQQATIARLLASSAQESRTGHPPGTVVDAHSPKQWRGASPDSILPEDADEPLSAAQDAEASDDTATLGIGGAPVDLAGKALMSWAALGRNNRAPPTRSSSRSGAARQQPWRDTATQRGVARAVAEYRNTSPAVL